MTEDIEIHEDVILENSSHPMLDMARKVLLASIGAVALTQEEIEKFVVRLVDRGEIAEKDGRKLIKDIMEKRRTKTRKVRADAENEFDGRLADILGRMNIPRKSDIDELNKKISELSKKVDSLKK